MSTVGYARVSTDHQDLTAQHDALETAGCERVFTNQLSGVATDRPGLAALLDYVRPGDTVVVTALDRLGRSLSGVISTIETLTEHQVLLKSLREGIDYSTATGKMLAGIFAALAGYERELMHERAAAARAAARARGRNTGRPPRLNAEQVRQVRSLREEGESIASLMAGFASSRATIYRALHQQAVEVDPDLDRAGGAPTTKTASLARHTAAAAIRRSSGHHKTDAGMGNASSPRRSAKRTGKYSHFPRQYSARSYYPC